MHQEVFFSWLMEGIGRSCIERTVLLRYLKKIRYTGLKIILLEHYNNYVGCLSMMNTAKSVDILTI